MGSGDVDELSDRATLHGGDFEALRRELGDDDAFATFLQMYLDLLPGRLQALREAVSHPGGGLEEPALNLAAISRMIGARRVARQLELLLDDALSGTSERRRRVAHIGGLTRDLRWVLEWRLAHLRPSTVAVEEDTSS